jgi:hypothetical protein
MTQTNERGVFTIPTTWEKTEDGKSYIVTKCTILSFTKMGPSGDGKLRKLMV